MWETRQWGFPGSRRTGAPLAPSLRASGRASVLPGALSPQQGPVVGGGCAKCSASDSSFWSSQTSASFPFPLGLCRIWASTWEK